MRGRSVTARSFSRRRPSATSWTISADVNVLLMLANAKAVDGFTGTRADTSARPLTPVQLVPSGNRIVVETPGIPSRVLTRSRVAWSRAWSSWVCCSAVIGPAIGLADGATGGVEPTGMAETDGSGVADRSPESTGPPLETMAPDPAPPDRARSLGVGRLVARAV